MSHDQHLRALWFPCSHWKGKERTVQGRNCIFCDQLVSGPVQWMVSFKELIRNLGLAIPETWVAGREMRTRKKSWLSLYQHNNCMDSMTLRGKFYLVYTTNYKTWAFSAYLMPGLRKESFQEVFRQCSWFMKVPNFQFPMSYSTSMREQLATSHELHIPTRAPAGDTYPNFCPCESLGCFPVASRLGSPLMSYSLVAYQVNLFRIRP